MDVIARAVAWLGEPETVAEDGTRPSRLADVVELGEGLIVGSIPDPAWRKHACNWVFWNEGWHILFRLTQGDKTLEALEGNFVACCDAVFAVMLNWPYTEREITRKHLIEGLREALEPVVDGVAFYDEPRPLPDIYPIGPV